MSQALLRGFMKKPGLKTGLKLSEREQEVLEFIPKGLILQNLPAFFTYYVLGYGQGGQNLKVSITGSVAYHFRNHLYEMAAEMGIQIEKIVQQPIEGLVRYHVTTYAVTS